MVKKQSRATQIAGQKGNCQDSIRLGFFGASGSGKTYRAKQLTRGLRRLVVFDPTPELDWRPEVDYALQLPEGLEYIRDHFDSEFRIAVIPTFGKEQAELEKLCLFLIRLQRNFAQHRAKLTLVADELDLGFCSGTTLKNPRSWFGYLCRRGRHLGINLLGISQRINQVDTAFRSNLSGVYLFQHTELIDIKQALALLGMQHRQDFLKLQPRQYIYKSGAAQKIVKN